MPIYAHLLLLCERFEESVDYILMHGGGHNGSLAHVHDAVHLALVLNHYGLLRTADPRVVAFEPPVAPGRIMPPFDGDSGVLLRSDIAVGPGADIAAQSREDIEDAEGGAEDECPFSAAALLLGKLMEWYHRTILRLPVAVANLGRSARKQLMEQVRSQNRHPRIFRLAADYACFLAEGGMGAAEAEKRADAFEHETGPSTLSGERSGMA